MPGIVLIDEIETHLHLELPRRIMDLLTTIFPDIQFIVSTHPPFILNTVENAGFYDLEDHVLAKDGLTEMPYEGIVELKEQDIHVFASKFKGYGGSANGPASIKKHLKQFPQLKEYIM